MVCAFYSGQKQAKAWMAGKACKCAIDVVAKEMSKQCRQLPCFIQVNTGEEEQKGGIAPDGLPGLLDHCRKAGLAIRGLMCIPPVDELPGPHFALLNKLARRHGLAELSMGMSADFEQAIALGATHIRMHEIMG